MGSGNWVDRDALFDRTAERMTITCPHATGCEMGPGDVTSEPPIEIDLGAGRRRAAA